MLPKAFLFLYIFWSLSGCSIGEQNKRQNALLAEIEVMPIESIEGVDFYYQTKSLFPPSPASAKKYLLEVVLAFNKSYNIIQPNSDIWRETQNIKVTYKLIEKSTSKVIIGGSFSKMNSYSMNESLYSNIVLKQDSIAALARNAALEIRNRILMHLNKVN